MSDEANPSNDLDAIRQRKLERLRADAESSDAAGRPKETTTGTTDTGSTTDAGARTPTEPIPIDGTESFRAIREEYDVVLADFSATWCGPCRTLEPIVERVAARSPGAVATIDVDANPDLAGQYDVRGVPTLLLFADGEQVERLVGVQDEAVLTDLIERHA